VERRWVVRPREGEIEVRREDMRDALMDAEAMIARAGGHLAVVTHRMRADEVYADGIRGEAITVGAVFEWKDRTDARPQPEATIRVPQQEEAREPEPELRVVEEPQVADDNPDGLVPQDEPDVSAVPAHAR